MSGRDATPQPSELRTTEMRRVLGAFASGVTVVTGDAAGRPVGFACQSFSSLSLDPPLVLFCPARSSSTWPLIRASGSFTVNVLADDQEPLCRVFATPGDRFTGLGWATSPTGPVLPDVLASVHCDVEAVHDGGDHELVVGRVRDLVLRREAGPLVFFRGGFGLDLPS